MQRCTMRATWVLLAFTALLGAVRCDLVDDVQKTIEDFRALMPTGDAALDIPQLEPLSISRIPLSIKVTPFNANIVAKNIVASGASGFQITKISQRDDGKLALSLEIPTIEVTGEYTIDGKVKVGFISVKLSGSGPLSLSAGGIKGDGVADVQEDSNGALHVNDLQITSWSYKKMKVQLDGLFGGGVMGKTVNALINKIIPPFIKSNKQKINELIQAKAKSFINKYLDGISGNKALREYVTDVMSEDWIISTETQGMLNQLAKTVLAAQVADKSSDSPTTLEEQTAHILESFKAMMKDGRPDFNIPVLDPAVVNKLAIDVKHALFNAKIIATDANVQGVSDFSVTKISQIDDTNKVTVEVEIPAVKIESQFEMHGKVSIPFAPAINDFGPLQLNITDLQLAATVEVLSNPDGSYNIGTVVMDSWSFSTIKIQLDNLLGGGTLGKAANNLFNKIFPTLVENDRPKINRRLENVVKNLFNAYLDGIAGKTSDDLSAKLEEISELFRSAMKTGRADINIPVMDPAVVEVVSVEVDKWPIVADISLSKITVSGASDFKLTKVSQIVGTNKVAVDIEVPSIVATCTYDVESTVHAAFLKFNLNRQGPLQLNIQGLTATTIAELSVESDEQLGLINFEVESLSYSSIEVQVDDWNNGSFFKRLFNKLVNKLVPSVLIRPHETEVSEWASRAGQRIIGHFIDAVAGRVVLPNLDVRAESLIEQFKGLMKTGSKTYNMPVYDPASVNDINLEVPLLLKAKAALEVSDINVLGSSDFAISKITQSANTNNLDIDIVVPALATNCKFLATTTGVLNLKDSGSATANIDNLTISVTASLSSDINGFLVLRKLEIRSWSMGGIKVAFENLDKLGTLGKALSKVINKVLPTIIEAKRASLSEWAEEAARNVIDKFLAGVASQATLPQAIRAGYFYTPESILKELANFASLAA